MKWHFLSLVAASALAASAGAQAALVFYNNSAAFDGAAGPTTTQTFSQANDSTCSNALDGASNACGFVPGDIAAGLSLSTTGSHPGADLYAAPAGTFGISNGAVFADYFVENLNIGFAPGSGSVALGLLSEYNSSDFTVSIFDAGNVLLGSTTVSGVSNSGASTFFGVVGTAGEMIARINLSSNSGEAEGVDLVKFGAASTQIPEPGSLALVGLALLGAGVVRKRST